MASYNQTLYYQGHMVPPNTFAYQYDQQPKTPTSLHTRNGYSPVPSGPLSTPPRSRHPSQPAEQQFPDQMVYDEAGSSLSNSPTSTKTPPDHDQFDFDMLDGSFPTMVTTQTTEVGTQAEGMPMYFSDHVVDDAFQQTLDAQQYFAPFPPQPHQHHSMQPAQPYNNMYGQNYTRQPPRHDPWNVQGPLRNPNEARSSAVMFDLHTDPQPYPPSVSVDAPGWNNTALWIQNTNTTGVVSPDLSGPMPRADNWHGYNVLTQGLPLYDQNAMDTSPAESRSNSSPTDFRSNYSPIEIGVTEPSPSPDSQNFINFSQNSSYFTDRYITESHFSASPGTSVVGHANNSPYQSATSPQMSVPSPISDAVLYQHSDSSMNMDVYQRDDIDPRALQPPSPAQIHLTLRKPMAPSPPRTAALEVDHETEADAAAQTAAAARSLGNRTGGRALGTHLQAEVAKAAHDMRKIVACWHCVLQRDKCGPGDVCERCLKRSQRPNADCGLGCCRMKLVELVPSFLPTLYSQMHENGYLMQFADRHIAGWLGQEITVKMTCGQRAMPRFDVKVYEFRPKDQALLVSIQYRTDRRTFKRVEDRKHSPALGMQQINHSDEKKYDKYVNDIVENHLDDFAKLCWLEDDNDFQERLFRLMMQLKPQREDEKKLLKETFRLIVCTFIMSHTLTMAEETKFQHLEKMRSYTNPHAYIPRFTSPRLTNRQLKYFFHRLQRSILSTVLNKLQQIFKSSKGCDKWLAAFVAVVGMAMAHEDQQKTMHVVMDTKATTENLDRRDMQHAADKTCEEIDDRMRFISHLFRWKYNRRCNPLKDLEHDWEGEAGFGDANSVSFVRQVAQLVKENIDFLTVRQTISINHANQTKYTSRLVGQFLLAFWLPQ
ncbi:hypothetical protein EJ04DRAFT_197310 [Polyplosphaeria fusca]|uniref:Uncharacterized protein n=1 Tax=Polyplosphaeria fusca TaxID=682080 RepID=A0A9P4V8I4_9PLEO|nr:hypothetical protein EJ04DRAFT_197310 [Polyplosphaeria fusca]